MQSALPSAAAVRAFQERLLTWFHTHRRKFPWRNKSASTYDKIIAEVLLQRTRAETIAKFYPRFINRFPSWRALAQSDEETLRVYLKPIGLWQRRAEALVKLAREMKARRGILPRDRPTIERLPGVGQYIANAIERFAYDVATPLLDVNMARVLERHYGPRHMVDIRYDPYLQRLAHGIVKGYQAAAINWAIIDLAAIVCTRNAPSCGACPLQSTCRFAGTTAPSIDKLRHRISF